MQDSEILPELSQASILIVDDDALSRRFIERALEKRGFTKIYTVDGGVKALAWLEQSHPDIVILDIFMAGLNGLECCKWIRAHPKLKDLPVLMLTALADETMRFQAFDAGATDFVSKPLHPEELYARVKVHLQNRLALKDLQLYKKRVELELSLASELQANILPPRSEIDNIAAHCKLDIASYLRTSSELGGDFWGIKRLFQHQTAVWMVDFSGHGVAAALNAFRLQAYLKEHSEWATRPGDYLSHLNDKLLQILMRGYFATMFYGIIDTRGNKLHYACACSPHPLIRRKDGSIVRLDGTGSPLGICMQFYQTQSINFYPGDALVLYSDALTETLDNNGKYITEDDLENILSAHVSTSASELKESLVAYFNEHANLPLMDDLTLTVIQHMD